MTYKPILMMFEEILTLAGAGFENVVRVTVYMQDLADFNAVNNIYKLFFKENAPARVAIQVCISS